MNPDEATFIALHIVNAEMNTNMSQMYDITKILDGCIQIAGEYYQKKWKEEEKVYMTIHLKCLNRYRES